MQNEEIEARIAEIRNGNRRPKRGELARLIARDVQMRSGVDRQRKSRLKREATRQDEALIDFKQWQAGFLKRGPRPDPNRENAVCCTTMRFTKREARALAEHQKKMARGVTQGTFMRFVVCQWLEAQREPRRDPVPFDFNPANLDWRTKVRA